MYLTWLTYRGKSEPGRKQLWVDKLHVSQNSVRCFLLDWLNIMRVFKAPRMLWSIWKWLGSGDYVRCNSWGTVSSLILHDIPIDMYENVRNEDYKHVGDWASCKLGHWVHSHVCCVSSSSLLRQVFSFMLDPFIYLTSFCLLLLFNCMCIMKEKDWWGQTGPCSSLGTDNYAQTQWLCRERERVS